MRKSMEAPPLPMTEAEKLTQATRYMRNAYHNGHYSRNLNTTSDGAMTSSKRSPLQPQLLSDAAVGIAAWKRLTWQVVWRALQKHCEAAQFFPLPPSALNKKAYVHSELTFAGWVFIQMSIWTGAISTTTGTENLKI